MARQDDSASESTTGGGVETWRRPDPLTDPLPEPEAPTTAEVPVVDRGERDDLDDLAVFSDYRAPRVESQPRPVPTDPWLDDLAPEDTTVDDAPRGRRDLSGIRPASPATADEPAGLSADSLTAEMLLRRRRPRPRSGAKRVVWRATGGKVNLGPSRRDRAHDRLLSLTRTPIVGCHRLAVISLKGGVGKTTTAAALGAMFSELRGDRVIAVDANPDRGTLIERVPRESAATIRDLLNDRHVVTRYADVRAYTSQSPNRLEVLASDTDPAASQALSEHDYRVAVDILERFYNLIITDCGTGLLHGAMQGVLGVASSLVVVSSASLDGARSASATLDWLEKHGLGDLAKQAVVVISCVRPGSGNIDVRKLEEHFAARCRDVILIPYDPHLEAGGILEKSELAPETLKAYADLAAAVGEGFGIAGR
jgi:MinD-like ATPase involved in chromosome partitioning or flagellar assembly